jgi:hypothetical protein
MSRIRLVVLLAVVTALLVVAGIGSNGRPLMGGRGAGPTPVFFDYAYTTIALLGVALLLVFAYAVLTSRLERSTPRPRKWYLWSTLLGMCIAIGVALLIFRAPFGERLRQVLAQRTAEPALTQAQQKPLNPSARAARLRWDEVLLIVAAITAVGVLLAATRPKASPRRPRRERPQEAVADVLDESLDDLRREPDLRRAIIAAYARMERALAAGGLPRRPSEAPFEYVERALRELDASAEAARRLTGLFEWAKFSQHEPEPTMRDEAIDALVAIRDELRAPAAAAAA